MFASVPILYLCVYIVSVDGKGQYVEPLNMGMQFAIPYDAANIFLQPRAAAISTFLSASLVAILFFGVITSPFGYMFGIPSRKYVLGNSDSHPALSAGIGRSFSGGSYFDGSYADGNSTDYNNVEEEHMREMGQWDFRNTLIFLPQEDDFPVDCHLLLLCYAHSFLPQMPVKFLKLYQFFSRRLANAGETTRGAIRNGFMGWETCDLVYSRCPYGPFKLLVKSLQNLIPSGWRGNKDCQSWTF